MLVNIYECEVITPLFMGGADARTQPEIRPPSFRGSMRYWFRALVGGTLLDTGASAHMASLKQAEADVFGSTDKGSGINVRIKLPGKLSVETFAKDTAIHTPQGNFVPTGKYYLLWSMASSGREGSPRYLPAREYIQPGNHFEIIISSRLGMEILSQASASLWLLTNLGALGARANRGAGSLYVVKKSGPITSPAFKACLSINELQTYLSDGIQQCLQTLGDQKTAWRTYNGEQIMYDHFSPKTSSVWVVSELENGWGTYQDALNGLGGKLRDFRSHLGPLGKADHDAVIKWMESDGQAPQIKRAAFGLPIPFRYSGGGPGDIIISENSDRRASPLHIRITRLTTGRYVGVLTLFRSQFLASGKELQLQTRRWKAPPPTNYNVIDDFVGSFQIHRSVQL